MKTRLNAHLIWGLLAALAGPLAAAADDNGAARQSVFILPAGPSEGCDPFYPTSTRPYREAISQRQVPVALSSALQVKGYSEVAGRRFVIINNHTFGEGDEGDVLTPAGRVHIRCVSVSGDAVVVEAGGERIILNSSDQP